MRWRGSLGLLVAVSISGAVVMAAVAGARRTDSAYTRFLADQNAGQGYIASDPSHFFGFAGVDLDEVERLPGLQASARFAFFTEFLHTPSGLDLTPIGDRNPVVLFAGADDRFDRVLNRMRARSGRLPDPDRVNEVAVSYEAARRYRIHVGDVLR